MPAATSRTRRESAPQRQSNAKGGGALFVLVLLGLLAVGGGIFALIFFLGEHPKADDEMLAYLPAGTNYIVSVDVDALKSGSSKMWPTALTGLDKGIVDSLKNAQLPVEENASRIVVGYGEFAAIGPATAPLPPSPIALGKGKTPKTTEPVTPVTPAAIPPTVGSVVVRMKQKVDKAKLIAAWSAREERKGEKSFYVLTGEGAGLKCYFPPNEELIVFTRHEKSLENVLAANPAKPTISEELQELVKRVSRGPVWFAMIRKAAPEHIYQSVKDHGDCPYLTSATVEAIKDLKSAGGYLRLVDDRVEVNVVASCSEAAIALRAADKLKQLVLENRTNDLKTNPTAAAIRKKVMPSVLDAYGELQRTAVVGFHNNAIEVSASMRADDLMEMLKAMTDVSPSQSSVPLPPNPMGLPMPGGPGGNFPKGKGPPPPPGK